MLSALNPSTHSTSRALTPEFASGTTPGSIGSMFSIFMDAPAFLIGSRHTRRLLKNRAAISLGFEHTRYRRLTLSSISPPRHDPLTDDQRLAAHFSFLFEHELSEKRFALFRMLQWRGSVVVL